MYRIYLGNDKATLILLNYYLIDFFLSHKSPFIFAYKRELYG